MMHFQPTTQAVPARRAFRTVAVVSRSPHDLELDTVLDTHDQDLVFVESPANAYSRIKRMSPDMVVLCLSSDDTDSCQVLSMLALDDDTSRIPVRTHFLPSAEGCKSDETDLDLAAFAGISSN